MKKTVENKTALVIEDDENNMALITFILQKHGYRTLSAATGREGLRLARQRRPDFVLLDIQLPDVNGEQLLAELRDCRAGPVVALTSHVLPGDRERLLAAGCSGYIEKPIDPGCVVKEIRAAVGHAA